MYALTPWLMRMMPISLRPLKDLNASSITDISVSIMNETMHESMD